MPLPHSPDSDSPLHSNEMRDVRNVSVVIVAGGLVLLTCVLTGTVSKIKNLLQSPTPQATPALDEDARKTFYAIDFSKGGHGSAGYAQIAPSNSGDITILPDSSNPRSGPTNLDPGESIDSPANFADERFLTEPGEADDKYPIGDAGENVIIPPR